MSYKNQKRYNQENSQQFNYQQNHHQSSQYKGKSNYHQQQQQHEYVDTDYQKSVHAQKSSRPQTAYQQHPKGRAQTGGYNQGQSQQQQQQQQYQQMPRQQHPLQQKKYIPPQHAELNPEPQGSSYRPFDKPSAPQKFNQRPQTSTQVAKPSQSRVQPGQSVQIVSNQYRLKLGSSCQVYQYALEIVGLEYWDTSLVQKIIKQKNRSLEKALGLYVVSGASIYILCELEEDVKFDVCTAGQKYTIVIDTSTQSLVHLNDKFENAQNTVSQNLLNIIVKQAFRETDLKQIGKTPRFFDLKSAQDLERSNLRIMSGFKSSVVQTQLGCTLVVDSIFKFMSTESCLTKINQLRNRVPNAQQWQAKVCDEFVDQSIIADWGNQKQYIVHDVCFDINPVKYTFQAHDGQKLSIADYFLKSYNKKITDVNQPLFQVKMGQRDFYLPPEFCKLDGVPNEVRKGGGMRDALAKTRIDPQEKINRVQQMVKTLFSQKAVKDWEIEVEEQPICMNTTIMAAPQMITDRQVIRCDDKVIRNNSILKPKDLLQGQWIMVYENPRVFQIADNIYNDLCKASGRLGIRVEEPSWIELEKETDRTSLEQQLLDYMYEGGHFRHPSIVLVVLQRESNYEWVKEMMLKYNIPSQVVTTRNGSKFNLSKAGNILKQMNSKMGGDLYRLKFPENVEKRRTMLIGIDVCHAGQKSVVGFAASTNKQMTQYYSRYFIQQKYKELVHDQMQEAICEAIETFAQQNNKEFPTNFVIYRDGVGDAMQQQILSVEIPQLEQAIKKKYNQAAYSPEITVVVVNKRISQRFFVKEQNGRMINPPPGCIIDKQLVCNHGDEQSGNKKFDFYLTPAECTQGCVLPTHFYVPKNDSSLTKFEVQTLTYTLCYLYFNWQGSIKVPAPCQYAHKIAEFFTNINAHRNKPQSKPQNQQQIHARRQCEQQVVPLNTKLHYL